MDTVKEQSMTLMAEWIWQAGDPAPRNVLVQFRRAFTLAAAPAQAKLHLSADARYLLYVNGLRLGYGPARNYHFHYEYDTYDLAPYLRPGENVLAIAVSHWGEGTFHHQVRRGGMLAQLDLDGRPHLWSDAQWKTQRSRALRQDTPRIACQLPWEEQVDARLEDVGWTEAGYDDSTWPAAVVIGPVGVEPWGTLSPRTIPFLTDEPLTPVRVAAQGTVRRPEVVAAIHAGPYLAPGDVTANRQVVDGLIATRLHVPRAGAVTLKRCSIGGGDPPPVWVDGRQVEWELDPADMCAALSLAAGDHAVLIDWHGRTHDMDLTFTASGIEGLAVTSPLPGQAGTWAIAAAPGAARAAARQATSPAALLGCGAAWQPVAAIDTPAADVYMDMTSSMPVEVEARPVRMPLRVPLAPDGQARRYLIDFGRMTIGWIELEVEAPAGTTFDLLGYEGVQDGRPQMPAWMNNTLRYICRDGRQTYVSTLRRGLRYLIVAVHGTAGEAVLHGVKLRLATYPWSIQGAFRCSDPRLNQIWEACAYTLRLCSEDTFTDCPTYEQTFWTGDACLTDLLLHMAVHGDARLPRRCLLLVADSLQRLPIGGAQVPGDWENTLLPNWSWLWAMGCAEYYQLTGDDEFARLAYPALAKQARFIEAARNAAGLVELIGYWHLLDWVRIPDGPEFILAHESCLAVGALNATATIARAAGQPFEAEHWQAVAGELAAAVNRECWRADQQAYGDTWLAPGVEVPAIASASDGTSTARVDTVSQPTNIVALLAGVAPPERAAAIRPRLLDCPEGWVASGTPWMHSLACHVWAEHGDLEPVLDTIRDRWGDMLDKAATTTWETFVGFDVLKGWWTRSWCHAWSAFPAYLLSAYVLGVRPLEPGFRRALVAPRLADLTWAEGRVPTPHGPIGVRLDQAGAGMAVQVTLPEGVAAEVRLPVLGEAPPAVDGAWAEIARAGAEYVIRLPAGAIVTIHT